MAKQREKFANGVYSTLDGGINDSVTSLDVISAEGFPTDGNFRVQIDDEVMKVTGVSTNTFTVERGSSPATHSDGALVMAVWNYGAAVQMVKDNILFADTKPAYGRITDAAGNYMLSSDMTAHGYGSPTIADIDGCIYMSVPAAGTGQYAYLFTTPPATPWTVTMGYSFLNSNNSTGTNGFAQAALALKNSGNARITQMVQYSRQGVALFGRPLYRNQIGKLNSYTSFNSQYQSNAYYNYSRMSNWVRVTDNGTNLIYYHSADGIHFNQDYSVSRTDWLTSGPNLVGFGVSPEGSTMALNPRILVTHFSFS